MTHLSHGRKLTLSQREAEFVAAEVWEKTGDGRLATKLQSFKTPTAQLTPKQVFGRRASGAQTPCNLAWLLCHGRKSVAQIQRSQPLTRRLRRHPLPLGEGFAHRPLHVTSTVSEIGHDGTAFALYAGGGGARGNSDAACRFERTCHADETSHRWRIRVAERGPRGDLAKASSTRLPVRQL